MHHTAGTLQLPELREDQFEARLHFLIGIENDCACPIMSQAGRERQTQFAARRFLTLPLMQAHSDLVEFRLAHDAGQAQQQAIVVGARVVEAFAIREEHAEHRAEFEQLMPVPIVAGEPRSVEADHEPGVTKADLSDQLLESMALDAARTRFAEILVDDLYALMGPPQTDGAIDQAILQLRALLMLPHLVQGRLPHVNIGQFGAMRRREPLVSELRGGQHERSPPLARPRSPASVASTLRPSGRSAFASRLTGSAIDAEGFPPTGRMGGSESAVVETQRDLEGLEGTSRITSSARNVRLAFKCCINGMMVRALMRGGSDTFGLGVTTPSARSVAAIRIERLRPSASSTTTYAGPRPARSVRT